MNYLSRIQLALLIPFVLTGCSAIHNDIGPAKQQSELNEFVIAPEDVSSDNAIFCPKPELELAKVTPIVIPEPYNAKLYFLLDKTEFTAESKRESEQIYQEILDMEPTSVTISGHTDTAASNEYNDNLSQRRAERVRDDLLNLGVAKDALYISSEGEYRLLIPTPDETVEVRNRRVEINVR